MAHVPPEFHDLFKKRTIAHFVTMTPEGKPHSTPVWIDYADDENRLLVNTERGRRKERNVSNDPAVAASMTDPDTPYRYLSVIGEVTERTTEGAREHIDSLTQRYIGDETYPSTIQLLSRGSPLPQGAT
ncbi:MAG: pyridoxamine 5'-phosphate oxidase family protein [Halobacteriaceae archaeon]